MSELNRLNHIPVFGFKHFNFLPKIDILYKIRLVSMRSTQIGIRFVKPVSNLLENKTTFVLKNN
jgi:hypothetical protein